MSDIWTPQHVKPNTSIQWDCGGVTVFVKRINEDWLIGSRQNDENAKEVAVRNIEETPGGITWTRYALHDERSEIRFIPVMPKRPLLVKTRNQTIFPPGAKILFYVHLPIWIAPRISVEDSFFEGEPIPSIFLSDTWYGEPTHGHLCYALKTLARRRLEVFTYSPHRAICPVLIHNASEHSLDCMQILLKTRFLHFYLDPKRWLWTNQVNVRYHGTKRFSSITYNTEPPKEMQSATLLAKAPETPPQNFFLKTFGF